MRLRADASVCSTEAVTTVYNLRVADHHTYFVGGNEWGWDAWVHNASTSYAVGSRGTNQLVDTVASEIETAATMAESTLKAGKSGGTRWGQIYQRYSGTGHWIEKLAYGNAVQQMADDALRANPAMARLIKSRKLLLNKGSQLGDFNSNGNLLRPDYQLSLGGGRWGIIDISTLAQQSAGKISKYANPSADFLIDIAYR